MHRYDDYARAVSILLIIDIMRHYDYTEFGAQVAFIDALTRKLTIIRRLITNDRMQ